MVTSSGPGSGRRVVWIGASRGTDYHDLLANPAVESDAAALVLRHVRRSAGPDDLVVLAGVPAGSPLLAAVGAFEGAAEWHRAGACPALELPADPDAFEATRPARIRRSIRQATRRLGIPRAASLEHATRDTLPDHLEALFHLHSRQWEARSRRGVLADAAVRRFHLVVAPRLLDLGCLRIASIRSSGEFVAVLYGFLHRSRFYYYLSGVDPALARCNLGTHLIAAVCESAIGEGARAFDFLRGTEPYKYLWGAVDTPLHALTWHAP
jgi:CelD/BcsL family acetyltransferase involved in cellulose biosynthesis